MARVRRRDEPRGAAPSVSGGGGAIRALDAAAALRPPGPHMPLASERPERPALRRVDAPRPRVRGPVFLPHGRRDPSPHDPRGALRPRRVLSPALGRRVVAGGKAPIVPLPLSRKVWYR